VVTVNALIVTVLTWVTGLILKKTKLPHDMIPQVLYYVSVVSAYIIAVLGNLATGTAQADSLTVGGPDSTLVTGSHVVALPNPIADGTIAWIFTNIWDWIGRKFIFGKLLKIHF
jgi:hypothetical protein